MTIADEWEETAFFSGEGDASVAPTNQGNNPFSRQASATLPMAIVYAAVR
jgi:hypothetical protein